MVIEKSTMSVITVASIITTLVVGGSSLALAYSSNNERFARIETEKASIRETNTRQDVELRELRDDIKAQLREIKDELRSMQGKAPFNDVNTRKGSK